VLGPTRPFFSTYLESIWLLQLAIALDLLEMTGRASALGSDVRDRLIAPSADLIRGYDEGMSNRQVWNNAALLAAARLLDDRGAPEMLIHGPSGLVAHLSDALLPDGTWYEGENYHLFAHRGLWYGAGLAAAAGVALDASLIRRFEEGFATPFLTALPDFTFPSRRDSQYAVSLRQWRYAELCELGLARRADDQRLLGALHEIYRADVAPGDSGRWRSTAEAERNSPPVALTRAELGWRSLLFARDELPPLAPIALPSVVLESQGFAVLRRDAGRVYVALDYGHHGSGHGHPDRLNVILVDRNWRWLDDVGTGSYVDPSLHWYRSTLAHNAPLIDGQTQHPAHGRLLAFEERGGAGWVRAGVDGVAPGVRLERALVVMPDYLVDVLAWEADRDIVLDLPLHTDGNIADDSGSRSRWRAASPGFSSDGFNFLTDCERQPGEPVMHLQTRLGPVGGADLWVVSQGASEWWRATAPGPPGAPPRRFHFIRRAGARGSLACVWSWRSVIRDVASELGALVIDLRDGSRHEHTAPANGWHIALYTGTAHSSIDLGGVRAPNEAATPAPPRAPRADRRGMPWIIPRRSRVAARPDAGAEPNDGLRFDLGAAHYRRSEESWDEAGSPNATVVLGVEGGRLRVDVAVRKPDRVFAPALDENPLDNESPDVNSDGVQIHIALPSPEGGERAGSWLLVPEADGRVRITAKGELASAGDPIAAWNDVPGGYAISALLSVGGLGLEPGTPFLIDVLVNETSSARERRRGQLVLGGAAPDEFVYLLGDRQPSSRHLPVIIADA
jgi:hypothetical protein